MGCWHATCDFGSLILRRSAYARITGGVTGMPQFLGKFFPNVASAQNKASKAQKSAYCTFDDPGLQAWTASMFIAGAVTGEQAHH